MTKRIHGCGHTGRKLSIGLSAVIALAGLTFLPACAIYANYPPIGDDLAVNDPNFPPMPQVMIAALDAVTEQYPVEGQYAVNLPEGMTHDKAEWVVGAIGDADAFIVSGPGETRPIYHVSRIWIRGDDATVDILRPVPAVSDQRMVHQRVTVTLDRKGQFWQAGRMRTGVIGAAEPPPIYGWPEDADAPRVTDPTR